VIKKGEFDHEDENLRYVSFLYTVCRSDDCRRDV
jgi:hypothetical protein